MLSDLQVNTSFEHHSSPITAVIVGAGHRSMLYASYANIAPDALRIVGVVDPDEVRLKEAAARYGIPPERCYPTVEALVGGGERIADAAINGTMDNLHVATTIPLLQAGYHVLLEKPIGTTEAEVLQLMEASKAHRATVMICHVLRYAPFYAEIRRRVAGGDIGDILNLQLAEHVSYHHTASVFVRGKWNRKDNGGSTMLLQKCCHDLDLLAWMKSGIAPVRVASFGSRMFFREENAPEGAGSRCLVDCQIEASCLYSARKHYIEHGLWGPYVWHGIESLSLNPTTWQKTESLRTDNPFGRCVWRCDNTVVDHQSVLVEFADGSTATFNLAGNASKPCRTIRLIGTKGEIEGVLEDGFFVVRHPDLHSRSGYSEERVDLNVSGDMHGGGDYRLVEDFLQVLRGQSPSLSTTVLADSIFGHRIGFAADRAMEEDKWVEL